jgi:hypothetical protein
LPRAGAIEGAPVNARGGGDTVSRRQAKHSDARLQTIALALWDDDGGAGHVPKRERIGPDNQEYWLPVRVKDAEEAES